MKPCPCGDTPSNLIPDEPNPEGRVSAYGDCCCGWEVSIPFRCYMDESELDIALIEAWDNLPRKNET